jgi:nitroimidazol reductase NimA-like FMN-containing flavoprotein (pyridoxamine 5'-phosphate oxidase superfamily)
MKTIYHDKTVAEAVIRACPYCNVAMSDMAGTPYLIPMNFGYQDGILYLHSSSHGHKMDVLSVNPRVCVTFCLGDKLVWQNPDVACSYSMRGQSVMARGTVGFIDDYDGKVAALRIIMDHYVTRDFRFNAPAVNNVRVWRVPLEGMTCMEFGVPPKEAMHAG